MDDNEDGDDGGGEDSGDDEDDGDGEDTEDYDTSAKAKVVQHVGQQDENGAQDDGL